MFSDLCLGIQLSDHVPFLHVCMRVFQGVRVKRACCMYVSPSSLRTYPTSWKAFLCIYTRSPNAIRLRLPPSPSLGPPSLPPLPPTYST
jgi:hypothetical protein